MYLAQYVAFMGLRTHLPYGWLLVLLLAATAPASGRLVTDATGRTVDVPDRIERVMPAGQPAAVLIYTLAPEKMIDWPHRPSPEARAFLDHSAGERPDLPPLMREGKVRADEIRAQKPDLILDYGSTSSRYVERATRIQAETSIPVLLLDGTLERTPEIYRLLGPIFATEERANDLAAAADRLIATTREKDGARHEAGETRVYYARSADGLTTATSHSSLADVLRLIGVANVADAAASGSGELTPVSREQVYAWNPDAVMTNNPGFWKVREGPEWNELAAVASGRVYLAPSLPFGWLDEPPSVNRLLGLLWVGHMLYPAIYTDDLSAEARDFYRQFYRDELDGEQMHMLVP
jgi:iron complex transport system substrate-binding protein